MMLTRVTLSGLDEGASLTDVAELSTRYPFVEWGLLHSTKRSGRSSRYPSANFERVIGEALRASVPTLKTSVHLCGLIAHEVMSGACRTWRYGSKAIHDRIQLNGFSNQAYLSNRLFESPIDFIAQCSTADALAVAAQLKADGKRVSALWDQSGGKGVPIGDIPDLPENLEVGFAGGIGPDNVREVIERLVQIGPATRPFWIDMEASLRGADGWFDMKRAEEVLQLAEPFVAQVAE